jgi:regulator of replication initiation timing
MSLNEKQNELRRNTAALTEENRRLASELEKMRRQVDRHLNEAVFKLNDGDYSLDTIERTATTLGDYMLVSKVKRIRDRLKIN